MSARFEGRSIVLTSNKHVRDWPEIFAGDQILATAILDRGLYRYDYLRMIERNGKRRN